jgi:hypothetical protein
MEKTMIPVVQIINGNEVEKERKSPGENERSAIVGNSAAVIFGDINRGGGDGY